MVCKYELQSAEVSFVLSQFTRLTDMTDRQTDGRTVRGTDIFLMANAALHSMHRGKN